MCFSIAKCTTAEHPKLCPRIFWRIRTAGEFSFADISALGDELRNISIADERWALARKGHAAEAISMMVAEWPVSSPSPRVDALMTAVTMAALAGSAAAALVTYHTTAQLAVHLPEFRAIATSWLAVVKKREARRFSRAVVPRTDQCTPIRENPAVSAAKPTAISGPHATSATRT
ncbi:MAG: hypothetical protein ACXWCY_32915 [Burkholderiales bacterium]